MRTDRLVAPRTLNGDLLQRGSLRFRSVLHTIPLSNAASAVLESTSTGIVSLRRKSPTTTRHRHASHLSRSLAS